MELWTFAVRYVVDQWNNTPHDKLNMHTPNEVFASIKHNAEKITKKLPHYHTFGFPVYVLDSSARDAIKGHKWAPKSRVGIYLGHSRNNASTVFWVLNLATDHISPQYHIIFYDKCTTVDTETDLSQIDLWTGLSNISLWNNEVSFIQPLDDKAGNQYLKTFPQNKNLKPILYPKREKKLITNLN